MHSTQSVRQSGCMWLRWANKDDDMGILIIIIVIVWDKNNIFIFVIWGKMSKFPS